MIVYVCDWVKIDGEWRQVVDVRGDFFALLPDRDAGTFDWYDTGKPIDGLTDHLAHPTMQRKLKEVGL